MLKITALVIDDDELILRALSRTLKHIDSDIDVFTLTQPLELLHWVAEHGAPDLLFCDSLMPECSGVEVLEQARLALPATVRCLLTGDLSTNLSWQVGNIAHCYFAKPFTKHQLVDVIKNTRQLKQLDLPQDTKATLGALRGLPALTATTSQILRSLREVPPRLDVVADLLSQDPPLAAKVMQIANSAFLGFIAPVHKTHQAVFRLGSHLLQAVITCFELERLMIPVGGEMEIARCITLAQQKMALAESLGEYLSLPRHLLEELQSCCFLSAIGPICATCLGQSDWSEKQQAELSAYLLALWGFESLVVTGQLYLHENYVDHQLITLLHAVISLQIGSGATCNDVQNALSGHLKALSYTEQVAKWRLKESQ
ncbi:HDOD domain-containing protein [Pseudoalteromonas fenneropenaei]|uniref:HDOD domain-containing protein n=1 Tax=Pseudoalteromonas fenneropenaei TaxID=1737459 RepID=A0ABV7CG56_9GAMM